MSPQVYFEELMKILKVLSKKHLEIPVHGDQSKYAAAATNNEEEIFELIINRKSYKNDDYLTYLMRSRSYGGVLVRLDMAGAPHQNTDGNIIGTPHLHIYDEAHHNGASAIALSELTDTVLTSELIDSLCYFLRYNNIDMTGIKIAEKLV